MQDDIMTIMSESMNVIICPMLMTSVIWWIINNKNIFPMTKLFSKKITDLIFNMCFASSFEILIHPSVNKMNSKVSASTLLKLLRHCIQDVCDSFMAEKQNKIGII